MKRLIMLGLIFAALLRGVRADEGKFTASITPEDLAAAGLAGLTPAQLARLNALVDAYKSGDLATARRAADEALAAKQAAEAQTVRAEAMAEAARVEAAKADAARVEIVKAEAVRAEAAKSAPAGGVIARARSLLKAKASSETVALESSIPGKFHGWEPRQVFVLADGQRVQVANQDNYFTRTVENPKVQLVPAAMAGYWLRFPDLDAQVRVNLLGDN
jgi:hypothetical protein